MTRDGTVGRSDATEPNLPIHRDIDPVRMMRTRFADPIRASSPPGLLPTGRTHDCKRLLCGTLHFLLPSGGHPHMSCHGRYALPHPMRATSQIERRDTKEGIWIEGNTGNGTGLFHGCTRRGRGATKRDGRAPFPAFAPRQSKDVRKWI